MTAASTIPASCAMALKEWATVLEAMGRGEQLVLIRKGGLMEPGSGFEMLAPACLLYPTFEHQAVNYVRPEYRRYFEEAVARRAPDGQVRFDLIGMAGLTVRVDDPGVVERLSRFHIYNEQFVTQRLKWQPDQPLVVVVVRAYRLAQPQTITTTPRYAGCKSWVELEAPVSLAGAAPVMDDAAFHACAKAVQALLGGGDPR